MDVLKKKTLIIMKSILSIIFLMLLTEPLRSDAQNIKPDNSSAPSATPVAAPGTYAGATINFIRTWQPNMPVTDIGTVTGGGRTVTEVKESTQYFDGLGRPVQMINKAISPGGNDLVAPVIYDSYGREQYKYLPYVQQTDNPGNGRFKPNPFNNQQQFYQNAVLNPGVAGESIYYNQVEFEKSPLDRVLKSYAPGNSWAKEGGNRPIQYQYLVNTAADAVRIWDIADNSDIPTSSNGRVYTPGELFKNVVIDEAQSKTIEYKDKQGRVILKKVQSDLNPGEGHGGWLCTYYVYDDLDNLRCVIPPKAVELISGNWIISSDVNSELCFSYRYDTRKRMVIKKVPGAGAVYMVYDKRDRLVFTQDAVQRDKSPKEWLSTFYDGINRPSMTAIYRTNNTREALQDIMNNQATGSGTITYSFPANADLFLGSYGDESSFTATNR